MLRREEFLLDVAQIDAVEANRSVDRIVEPLQERHHGGFARAAGADDGNHLAGLGLEVNPVEDHGDGSIGSSPKELVGLDLAVLQCHWRRRWAVSWQPTPQVERG
jgi:hypothetical protein